MRIGYSEDEDYPGQFELWQANCRRSLKGRAGQAALRELEAALLALPDKRLIADAFTTTDGDVCPLAALARYKGIAESEIASDPESDMEGVGVELGMPRLVAWKVVELNDIQIDGRYEPLTRFVAVTPEERYEKVLAWVRRQLAAPNPVAGENHGTSRP